MANRRQPCCPVCYQPVVSTQWNTIWGHLDTCGEACPAGGIPFDCTLIRPTQRRKATQ